MDCGRRCGGSWRAAVLGLAGLLACGCQVFRPGNAAPGAPGTLGQISDQVFLAQETNAEASDFVLYDHEFIGTTARLNTGGEDHLKQIAARVRGGAPFPVIVERTMAGVNAGDEYALPVQPDPELDGRRRDLVVRALQALGVAEADQRV